MNAPTEPDESSSGRVVRALILSDTHFPARGRELPAALLERAAAADLLIHAGDLCDRPALELLRRIGPPLHVVLGNNDRELAGELPERLTLELAGHRIGVVHDGGPRPGRLERLRRAFPDHEAVVFGHSHLPLHERADDGFQIFNPGSPTDRRGRWPVHTFAELEADAEGLRFRLVDLEP